MNTPGPPYGAPDPSAEPQAWGQQPPGGWGGPAGGAQQGWPQAQQTWHQPPQNPGRGRQPGPGQPHRNPGPDWHPGPQQQPAAGGRTRRIVIIAAIVVVVAAVGVLGFWKPGFLATRVFDQAALQDGVTQVLTRDYGHEVSDVRCADGITVAAGTSFTCEATVDGERVTVPIMITSDDGHYQVGRV
ncbi:DUF4333 domain-containing protein [Pseudonocardia asaccharolytica]|uniref:DUF4333 domain-containing protein n=1 Tax=Pseudonocardia asaccharolytica DSM 44247 = NBRC 16224 TaxID=1123024 RepID=A0A511D4W3_9PSEU|nr:DUF4333 domain-containing protein [Pseudonocardia asaccharolytica]GEL19697.1 hypothetical protein PA7_35340 [Pseudonocardia asaccharolytica DSM 44247 = NBRC 16224]